MAENTFDRFSVFFTGDTVFLDGAAFPLGQLTTDVLNLDGEIKQTAPPVPHRNGSTLSGI